MDCLVSTLSKIALTFVCISFCFDETMNNSNIEYSKTECLRTVLNIKDFAANVSELFQGTWKRFVSERSIVHLCICLPFNNVSCFFELHSLRKDRFDISMAVQRCCLVCFSDSGSQRQHFRTRCEAKVSRRPKWVFFTVKKDIGSTHLPMF